MPDGEAVLAFHAMWDELPGMARLIDEGHLVVAANPAAEERGFVEGAVCAKVGDSAIHRKCKIQVMFASGEAQCDHILADRIRGWMPVKGRSDLCVHFAIPVPKE